jgi:hypothetical protein
MEKQATAIAAATTDQVFKEAEVASESLVAT